MRLRRRQGTMEVLKDLTDLVVLDPKNNKGKWNKIFGNDRPIYVELGMGKGKFISEMSSRNADVNYIGIDMYDELVRKASDKAFEIREAAGQGKPENLRLVLFNIEHIEEVFAPQEIERIFLNFSDPWPKKRHGFRRLTHPRFLQRYQQILNKRGEIHFKTDSRSLFEFSLNSFADMGLRMRNISLDLHAEGRREDLVMTEYESKFADQGINIHRCEVLIGEASLQEHVEHLAKSL
jgi:tRNA (guanine-N7-)-methyltransferase